MFVALAVRLIEIRQPFVDQWSWRQSDVAAIARNYYENGFHFGRPQIDWAGDAAGYVGTEFPILPFAAALCYQWAGVHEWIGRAQAVIFFVAALPFFFLLNRRLFGETAALWATFFYSFAPLSIVASRAFMPDIPSLSLALVGLYFFLRWVENDEPQFLLGSALLISVSLLIKVPTAVVGAPILYLTWRRYGWDLLRRWEIWTYGFVALMPSAIWYWHAHQVAQKFYPHHFFGAGGFKIEGVSWYWKIAWQTATSSLSPVLFATAMIGLFVVPGGKYRRVFHWWLAAMALFVFVVGYGNRHQWYQLPFVPIAAALAGLACQGAAQRLRFRRLAQIFAGAGIAIVFAISSFFYARSYFAPAAAQLRELGLKLKAITPPGSLIIAADDGDPTILYYAERKGWHFLEDGVFWGNPLDSAQAIADLEKLRDHRANYIVFFFGTRWWLDYYDEFATHLTKNATIVERDERYAIYHLNPPGPPKR